jgi:regulatory protein
MTGRLEIKETELARAKQVVERLLKYRSRSIAEVLNKLSDKGISSSTSKETIAYYQQIGAINDVLFARAWIASRLNKPLGLSRIRWELIHKGIPKSIIEQELTNAKADYIEDLAVEQIIQKRLRQYAQLPRITKQRRLFAYLLRRGFQPGTIRKAISQIQ